MNPFILTSLYEDSLLLMWVGVCLPWSCLHPQIYPVDGQNWLFPRKSSGVKFLKLWFNATVDLSRNTLSKTL